MSGAGATPIGRTRVASFLVGALLAPALAGCGDAPSESAVAPSDGGSARPAPGLVRVHETGGSAARRLALEADEAGRPWPEARVWRRFDVVAELSRWEVDAPAYGVTSPPGLAGSPAAPALAAGAARPLPVRFVRTGTYDPRRFDAVRLSLAFSGTGALRVLLRRAGEVVSASESLEVPVRDRPTEVVLPISPVDGDAPPCDELVLDVSGNHRTVYLSEVAFLAHPLGSRVPDPDGGSRLVTFDGEARRGVGLLPDRPVSARGVVPEDARLEVSYVVAREVDEGLPDDDGPTALEVSLEADGAPRARWREPLGEPGEGWRRATFDLSAFAGREVRLRFRLDGSPRVSLVLCDPWLVPARPAPVPTVLLVTSDTHRGDHVGALGTVDLRTPALDALAARGVLFEDAWATINNTTPSHAALFTGLHPRDTGVLDNFTRLAPAADTLAESFARAGFATWAALSSTHLGPHRSGLGQGFQRVSWVEDGTMRPAAETVERALAWLPEAGGRPLFLWVHVFDAHIPYEPPAEALARHWDPERDPRAGALPSGVPPEALPPSLRGITDLDYPRMLYRAEVESQDGVLARLFAAPRLAAGVVALVADHGECLGEDGVFFRHEGVLPATLHVPLVLAGPGLPSGVRSAARVRQTDLGRTLLDLAGLEAAPFPGRDLRDQLDPRAVREPRFALEALARSASVEIDGMLCVLWLFARDATYLLGRREAHAVQLFDVRADPACARDLVDERFEDAARMRALLLDWLAAADPDGLADHGLVLDEEQRAALEGLGYVESGDAEPGGGYFTPDDCAWCRRFEGR